MRTRDDSSIGNMTNLTGRRKAAALQDRNNEQVPFVLSYGYFFKVRFPKVLQHREEKRLLRIMMEEERESFFLLSVGFTVCFF